MSEGAKPRPEDVLTAWDTFGNRLDRKDYAPFKPALAEALREALRQRDHWKGLWDRMEARVKELQLREPERSGKVQE